eukprot:c24464_g2_i1 orf=640-1188(-)
MFLLSLSTPLSVLELSSSSSSSFHRSFLSPPSIRRSRMPHLCSRNVRAPRRLRCPSADGNGNGTPSGDASTTRNSNTFISKSRRELLLEYVGSVQPEFMELFVKRAPQQAVEAMRQTVTKMLGTLPSQFFVVSVSTELTATAGEDAVDAMHAFIQRLLGMSDPAHLKYLVWCLQASGFKQQS